MNSDLVVLSSCESGVGQLLDGEGMLGLNRSFVYAGVPNVIFSLWKVYDEATGQIMTEFYKNTLDGQSYSTALRTAKLKMLENPATAVPDIWAAFLLVGR
ncbi:CHAT domain-containing protein [Saprospiraceae bacterium]|nr:CHAT domain-containing protein [Bacteroidota bacterium]MDB4727205.1 CHAT domain-containing protein [Saprospiraceae bacterium]MDF1867447.1 CHAT domain-containing protein [Saprospiraceae bacterium]